VLIPVLLLFGFILMIGLCNQSNSFAPSSAINVDTTSVPSAARQIAAFSPEDSVRFRQRAREIVQAHSPTEWAEAEQSRMNYLADTVVSFGDTTDSSVRRWIAAKRGADERRVRAQAEATERQADAAKWSYYSSTDPMASRPSRAASIESENTVDFDFPYQGPQHATLTLRNHPSYGRDVIVTIREGRSFALPTMIARYV
jgi:hypothetical protein